MADELMTCSGMVTVRKMETVINSMRGAWLRYGTTVGYQIAPGREEKLTLKVRSEDLMFHGEL